jgi:hypothetical protein
MVISGSKNHGPQRPWNVRESILRVVNRQSLTVYITFSTTSHELESRSYFKRRIVESALFAAKEIVTNVSEMLLPGCDPVVELRQSSSCIAGHQLTIGPVADFVAGKRSSTIPYIYYYGLLYSLKRGPEFSY